jgi:hypothetical protein
MTGVPAAVNKQRKPHPNREARARGESYKDKYSFAGIEPVLHIYDGKQAAYRAALQKILEKKEVDSRSAIAANNEAVPAASAAARANSPNSCNFTLNDHFSNPTFSQSLC